MLQDKPKKVKDYSNPTKRQLFLRIQGECWRRAVTPFLMYLFMSLIAFACQAISNSAVKIVLSVVCILCGAAFNAHLLYHTGKMHYDSYLTGCLHRKNAVFGITSGGDHRVEREYRFWKGFIIGLCIGVPVIFFGIMAHFWKWAEVALMMITGWAIFPVQWIRSLAVPELSAALSIAFIAIPILVSGVFYIVGAMLQKKKKEAEQARAEAVAELAKQASEAQQARREQTEEQRRKTIQSKKKK